MSKKSNHLVYWQCRRGLLELDCLLIPFFKMTYIRLSSDDQRQFVELLKENDQQLLNWLVYKQKTTPECYQSLCQMIRESKQTIVL